MRFSAVHKVVSYLMVAAAFATLALSGELSLPVALGTALIGGISFFFEPARVPLLREKRWTSAWNGLTLVFFVWSIVDVVRADALGAGIRFLCFLLVNKLWNRRASRDYLQAYVVSFLMLIAAAAVSSDLWYALGFLAYVVFATWTLTLFHLRREMEENYLLKHSEGAQSERVEVERILNSRRIVGGSFLFGTGLVSLGVFLGAAVLFFLIPRVGFGFFVNRARQGVSTIGFSDRVELGEYGLIKDNPQVVMRVEFPAGKPPLPLRLRGVSFDQYADGRWSRTRAVNGEPLRRFADLSLVDMKRGERLEPRALKARLDAALEQHVYIEPLDTSVLFGAPMPIAFAVPQGLGVSQSIELSARGPTEVLALERRVEPLSKKSYTAERKSGLRYTVLSDVSQPPLGALLMAGELSEERKAELAPYLAPAPARARRVADKAHEIADGKGGPYQRALAIERWLSTQLRYTLDLKRDERYEPLEDFLFVQKAGHCEYFASAMAVMLRAVGVPSRTVNGFLAAQWNDYGDYLAVRHGDAHTWVEGYIEGAGWVTFDPTPPGPGGPATPSWFTRVRMMIDTVEMVWFKYVIEYDLAKQAEALSTLRGWSRGGRGAFWRDPRTRRRLALIGGALALAIALYVVWRRRRRRGDRPRPPGRAQAAVSAYERALRALERRGLPRAPSETGRALAQRAASRGDPAAGDFAELVELYYAVRFGQGEVPAERLDRLARRVVTPEGGLAQADNP
jgi:hypothetical protein